MFAKFILLASLVLSPIAASAQGLPAYPFIHTSGTGATKVIPDLGELNFEIAASGADPALALATVEERIVEIRALGEVTGLAPADVQVRDIRRDIKRTEAGEPLAGPVHEFRSSIKLVVRDLGKWKDVVGPLLSKPNVDGFMMAFDTTQRQAVEAELMVAAIKEARRKGANIAAGFGRKLGPVSAVSSGELKNVTRAMDLVSAEFSYRGNRRNDPAVRPDLLTIVMLDLVQSVDVLFRIQ